MFLYIILRQEDHKILWKKILIFLFLSIFMFFSLGFECLIGFYSTFLLFYFFFLCVCGWICSLSEGEGERQTYFSW